MVGISVFPYHCACLLLLGMAGSAFAEHTSSVHSTAPRRGEKTGTRALRSTEAAAGLRRQVDMKEAIDEALGIGHGIEQQGLEEIRLDIEPMWRALAKKSHGRVDRRSLRYVVQRYLLLKYSLSVVGLEPTHAIESNSEATLLRNFLPNYVRTVLEGPDTRHGFVLEDAVTMIASLRRLMENSGSHVLEDVYSSLGHDHRADVSRQAMLKIMERYLLRWMMGDDKESISLLEANETLKEESFEDWAHIVAFAHGRVTAFEYARSHPKNRSGIVSAASTWNALRPHFSFADGQAIAAGIAMSFGNYWAPECEKVKESLMKLDHSKTGRVKLSDFHGAALNGEWRFSESKEYLRQLGALDESSSWHGPRVVITNYMQAPSNCIVSAEYYRVCCPNECELHLRDLEDSIGAPTAKPEDVLAIVGRMTSRNDEEPRLTSALKAQLRDIASANAGKVPLHGRLFGQWLHFVFPLDCPFPHKSGTTTTLTPLEFGDDYMASEEEMAKHSALGDRKNASIPTSKMLEDDWMTQWSHEEELLVGDLKAPWEADISTPVLWCVLIAGFFALLSSLAPLVRGDKDVLPTRVKAHYV